MDKKQLEIILSKLKDFENKHPSLEQYSTPSTLASDVLWTAYLDGNIEGKIVADLGCGNGILAVGACLLGAKKVYAVDTDKNAVNTAEENAENLKVKIEFENIDILEFNHKVDTVIMNPPFGVQKEQADKIFLEKAVSLADFIYSIYKRDIASFLISFAKDKGFFAKCFGYMSFPVKSQFSFHNKKLYKVDASFWLLIKDEKRRNRQFI